ncbi:hypothetical protein G4Y79_20730 [Phototrophicus methaneseepsis]|uniref:C-type cytochrome biogenesis protein CcmI n=1 Tax=Phototrophicus methaneseepsis TaxID=2710758 RepID=A0A7S8E856_9CHLR|nr:hypothetical protein [Phototrophicus methaneseepsis]QPC82082.1 hypothetical protein G4Y79_20730 [Phototrophicus methaneseepsis]
MSLAALLVGLGLLAVVLWFVLRPLMQTPRSAALPLDRQRERALAYYERVLTNIRDLDEDHATGKIDEASYQQQRELWASRGVQILKMLDTLDHEQPLVSDRQADDATIDAAIEDAVQQAETTRTQQQTLSAT